MSEPRRVSMCSERDMATTKSKRKGMAPIRSIGCILKVNAAFLYAMLHRDR